MSVKNAFNLVFGPKNGPDHYGEYMRRKSGGKKTVGRQGKTTEKEEKALRATEFSEEAQESSAVQMAVR